MLRKICTFVAPLRVAVRPRTAVPLIATSAFAVVAANRFLVSGCALCLAAAGGDSDSSPAKNQLPQVECAVKPDVLESMSVVASRLRELEQLAPTVFPDDEKLHAQLYNTRKDSEMILDTLGNVYLDAVITQAKSDVFLEHAELKSKVEGWKQQYQVFLEEPDVEDGMEDDGMNDLLDILERKARAKQDKTFHRKGSGKGGPTGVH
jgi:hypothetical protein